MKIWDVLAYRSIQIDLARFHHLHDADISEQFRNGADAIDGVGRSRNFVLGILITETLRPYDIVPIDQRNRECRQIFVSHFLTDQGFECLGYWRVIGSRRSVGLNLCV